MVFDKLLGVALPYLGGADCENHKAWQAHQFHKAQKIAKNAILQGENLLKKEQHRRE